MSSLPGHRVRELMRALREVRDLERGGEDPTAHAAEKIVELVSADAGGLVLMSGRTGSATDLIDASFAGYPQTLKEEVGRFYLSPDKLVVDLAAMALVKLDATGGLGSCRRRRELVLDREWYRSTFVSDFRRPWRLDDSIYGGTTSAIGNYAGIGLFRAWGARPFSEDDAQIAELFAEGVRGAIFTERVALSPRQRETLECLLEGDSAKQIAAKLELSIHTVGEYVKAVYRAHRVNSRAELLAKVLRKQSR